MTPFEARQTLPANWVDLLPGGQAYVKSTPAERAETFHRAGLQQDSELLAELNTFTPREHNPWDYSEWDYPLADGRVVHGRRHNGVTTETYS